MLSSFFQLDKLVYWSLCSMLPQLSMKYGAMSTGRKYFVRNHIISLDSSICPWNMSLFISPELPLFYITKCEIIFNLTFWVTNFLFSLHELFCFKKSPSFGPAAEDDVTCERNCMKKISFQSAHWRKWMKWDWWKLFKDSILRQNCNLGKIKCVLRLSKDFFLKSVYKHTLPTKKNWERQSLPSEYTGQFFHCEKITPVL